jgi:hypothetical protein
MIRKVKVLGVRTPLGLKEGYSDIVGEVLEIRGNAFDGFSLVLDDGSARDSIHFYHKPVQDVETEVAK